MKAFDNASFRGKREREIDSLGEGKSGERIKSSENGEK